jgi:plasmid stability protein
MSMEAGIRSISRRALEAWLRTPDLTYAFIRLGDEGPPAVEQGASYEDEMRKVLEDLSSAGQEPSNAALAIDDLDAQLLRDAALTAKDFDPALEIGHAWELLHFALSGTREAVNTPEGQALLGGVELGGDVGYGPMRYHSAERVAWIARGLQSANEPELSQRLAKANVELYGGDPREAAAWIGEPFTALRDYYQRAAGADRAMFLFLV